MTAIKKTKVPNINATISPRVQSNAGKYSPRSFEERGKVNR
jgi:hypothetical protein